jgi:cyclohexyl-isocyanide hydratase
MKLGIPVYNGVNLLDVVGPLEMFYWAGKWAGRHGKNLETFLVSPDGKAVTSINGVTFEVGKKSFPNTPALDILWVPGGDPVVLGQIMSDPNSPYLKYLRDIAVDAKWVCSVCEGALLLARAGLLAGHTATTHWYFVDCLKKLDVTVDTTLPRPRFVESKIINRAGKEEKRLTGGGISSGLDEALQLIFLLFGEEAAKDVQVTTEYFPKPPVMGAIGAAPECTVKWH